MSYRIEIYITKIYNNISLSLKNFQFSYFKYTQQEITKH